ncbi:MAG: leucyl aminopeptidase [Acidimicrobiales bacterium]
MPTRLRSTLLPVRPADLTDPAGLRTAAGEAVTAVGVPVLETDDGPVLAEGLPATLDIDGRSVSLAVDTVLATRRGFAGQSGQHLVVEGGDGPSVVFVGLGAGSRVGADSIRRAAATFVRAAGRQGAGVLLVPASLASGLDAAPGATGDTTHAARRVGQAAAEGAALAAYRFTSHKSSDEHTRLAVVVVAAAGLPLDQLAEGVRRGQVTADAVSFARDLINEPPSTMNPRLLADAAADYLDGRPGVQLEVWDEDRIAAERLGGLQGVAQGSAEPPRLLVARYEPSDPVDVDGSVPHVVLVGKGITFDSGGLSLKTADGMMTMKTDMSGAAAVLATVAACGELGSRIKVTAIAPVTENMPGGRATKPGDVLTIRDGQTIEVLNTDAEGRLVLADGLALAKEMAPDAIVDLATLTGACVVALGSSIAGLFGNDDELIDRLKEASEGSGEKLWQLPLPDEYRAHIDSEVADMKNTGKAGQAGAIAAAVLLARFVGDVPWAHLDIAGPARSDEDEGITSKGGTGFGVRTLLELVERFGS